MITLHVYLVILRKAISDCRARDVVGDGRGNGP